MSRGRKDMKRAIDACVAAGLVYRAHGTHPRLTDPATGKFVVVSGTPSDPMAYRQVLRDVRKYLGVRVSLR